MEQSTGSSFQPPRPIEFRKESNEQFEKPESIEINQAVIRSDIDHDVKKYFIEGIALQPGQPEGKPVRAEVIQFLKDFVSGQPEEALNVQALVKSGEPRKIFIRPYVRPDGRISERYQAVIIPLQPN